MKRNPYRCEAGHESIIPYQSARVWGWCEACRLNVDLTLVEAPPSIMQKLSENIDALARIREKFEKIAETMGHARAAAAVKPSPREVSETERRDRKLGSASFPGRHIANLSRMDREGLADAERLSSLLLAKGPQIVLLFGQPRSDVQA